VIAGHKGVIDAVVRATEFYFHVTAIAVRQFLFDDVRLDGRPQMICLSGQVGRGLVIGLIRFECLVAKITPKYAHKSQFMRESKGVAYDP
jgi:hypothetical protein